jgi:hypothetical protein
VKKKAEKFFPEEGFKGLFILYEPVAARKVFAISFLAR